jgi:hypothetical protein
LFEGSANTGFSTDTTTRARCAWQTAPHPGAQLLMVATEHRPTQIIEPASSVAAAVILAVGRRGVPALFADSRRVAVHVTHAIGPAQSTEGLETFGLVDEVQDV